MTVLLGVFEHGIIGEVALEINYAIIVVQQALKALEDPSLVSNRAPWMANCKPAAAR